MAARQLKTQVVKASDARQHWSGLLNTVYRGEARIVVEKSGIPIAAIVSADDLRRLEWLEARREDGRKAIEEIRARNRHWDAEEVERDVAEALAEVRAEMRADREAAARAQGERQVAEA